MKEKKGPINIIIFTIVYTVSNGFYFEWIPSPVHMILFVIKTSAKMNQSKEMAAGRIKMMASQRGRGEGTADKW